MIDAVGGPKTGRFLRTLKRGGALFPIFPLGFSGADEAENWECREGVPLLMPSLWTIAPAGRMVVIERWQDQASLTAHLEGPQTEAFQK